MRFSAMVLTFIRANIGSISAGCDVSNCVCMYVYPVCYYGYIGKFIENGKNPY